LSYFNKPRNIALLSALLASAFVFICLFFFYSDAQFYTHVGLALSVFVLGYLANSFFYKKFLQDRIKLIFKNIFDSKLDAVTEQRIENIELSKDVISDVDDQVKEWAENKKEEILKLQEMEQFRKDFIGNLAHELKTPIFNIQGYIHTLLDGGLEDDKINRRFLEKAKKSVDRMTDMVQDMDMITRLEAHNLELDIQPFLIKDLIDEVLDSMDLKAQESNVKILVKYKIKEDCLVLGDIKKINQVLVNLMINGIKYRNEKINSTLEIRVYDMEGRVLIEVSDNGIGVSKEHIPRLFERFYRTDKSRSRDKGGSGLGLSIAKHIIEGHHQTIKVRSTENVGSTFSFTLDRAHKI
jgi:two-component system phosphate regulon sensor histidine kinase PhoR